MPAKTKNPKRIKDLIAVHKTVRINPVVLGKILVLAKKPGNDFSKVVNKALAKQFKVNLNGPIKTK